MIKTLFSLALLIENPSDISETQYVLEELQPALTSSESYERAVAIQYYSDKYDLPKYQWIAIMFQESSLWTDPTECVLTRENCTSDYGIGQVNYRVWGKHLKMDRLKALIDTTYSVELSAKVLFDYKKRYSKTREDWIYKYHSKTPHFKNLYKQRIDAVYGKIKAYLEEYRDEKRLGKRNFRADFCSHQDGQKEIPVEIFKSLISHVR